VARIEIQSDAVNEERLVEVSFGQTPRDVHLAEQAEVVITTGSLDHAVFVPQTAVTGLNGVHGTVWTVENGTLARRDVTVAAPLLSGLLPIVDRLPAGVQVVLSPVTGLHVGRATVIAPTAPE
jgi:HlyD family secretion protein